MNTDKIDKLDILLKSFMPVIFGFRMLKADQNSIHENEIPFNSQEVNLLLKNDYSPIKNRLELLIKNGLYKQSSLLGLELLKHHEWESASFINENFSFREIMKEIILFICTSHLKLNDFSTANHYLLKLEEMIVNDSLTSQHLFDKFRALQKEIKSLS